MSKAKTSEVAWEGNIMNVTKQKQVDW